MVCEMTAASTRLKVAYYMLPTTEIRVVGCGACGQPYEISISSSKVKTACLRRVMLEVESTTLVE